MLVANVQCVAYFAGEGGADRTLDREKTLDRLKRKRKKIEPLVWFGLVWFDSIFHSGTPMLRRSG